MSLGRKHLDFDRVYASFIGPISLLFVPTDNTFAEKRPVVSGMDLYQSVYDMCNILPNPMHEELFLRLATFLTAHCQSLALSIRASPTPLMMYASHWATYLHASQTLNIVCDVLNRAIVSPLRGVPLAPSAKAFLDQRPLVRDSLFRRQSIDSLAFLIWKDTVFTNLSSLLIRAVLDVIRMDREDVLGPHEACKALALSLVTLQAKSTPSLTLYVSEYEHAILAESRTYYQSESRQAAMDYPTCKFMRMAQIRLDQELSRAPRYLHPSSIDKLVYECNIQYIDCHKDKIRDSFDDMLTQCSAEDLQLAYSLLSRIPRGIDLLTEVYEKHIIVEGRNLISPDPRTMTFALSDQHALRTTEIASQFAGDAKFVASMDMAFRTIINDTAANAAKQLAQFTDWLLRKSNKQSETEVEIGVSAVMTLFVYVDDKDVFHKHYARFLARRLIQKLSTSDDLEYLVLTRLKVAQGVEYTSKLQRMFTDIGLSSELSSAFREHAITACVASDMSPPVPVSVHVLTAGTWPMSPSNVPLLAHLPEQIAHSVALFSEYYQTQHSGRKLFWLWHLCRVDVKLNMGFDKRYEINMSLHQWAVLSMFNDGDGGATVEEISCALGVPVPDVDRIVSSLVDAGLLMNRLSLAVNLQYSSKRTKLRLPPDVKLTSTSSGGTAAPDDEDGRVDDDRKLYLQATLVRLMKTHGRMDHNSLVALVIENSTVRFRPKIPFVKKCIELLLDKGYIERDPVAQDKYLYVA